MAEGNLVEKLIAAVDTKHKRILVLGDAMVDHYVSGHQKPCQDGCFKFIKKSEVTCPGGAANAHNCLSRWNVSAELYSQQAQYQPHKWRFVADNKIVYRYDDEEQYSSKYYRQLHSMALNMVPHSAGVLLSDYDKGFLTPAFIADVAALCQKHSIPCVADAKRGPEIYTRCIIKGNMDWYVKHGRCNVTTNSALRPYVGDESVGPELLPVECVNHVGAGDCFAAHLLLALAYGFTLIDAATIAHSAGRVYVQHPHNRAPKPEEVAADMRSTVATTS